MASNRRVPARFEAISAGRELSGRLGALPAVIASSTASARYRAHRLDGEPPSSRARDSTSSGIRGGNKRLLVPFADGIVTPDPVGAAVDAAFAGGDRLLLRRAIAHMLEASIGEGEPLHPMHARDADAAKIGKGLDRVAARLEPARKDVGVLERLAGALAGIGQHGMRRVADELDAPATPILRQRPREQAPFRARGHEAEKLLEARLGVGEAQPHLVRIAA